MRVYHPRYKARDGTYRTVKKYWIEFVDKREKRRRKVTRVPAYESLERSSTLGRKIDQLVFRASLDEVAVAETEWLENYAPRRVQLKLVEMGLLPNRTKEGDRPFTDYLKEFQRAVQEAAKSDKKKKASTGDTQARTVTARVRKLIEGCGFNKWRDVAGDKVNDHIESRPNGMSQQTAHFYVQAVRRFLRWGFEQGFIDRIPKIRNVSVPKNYGRCFELEEFQKLLDATRTGPERFGLTGSQRYLLYLVAVETGLRRGELRSLTVASFDSKNKCLFIRGENTKNQNEAVQFVTPETAKLLKNYCKGKMPSVQLFPIHDRSAEMIAEDCVAADVKVVNHKGQLTFHSLRHTCGSYLSAQGVAPRTVQEIMRHGSLDLTMNRYVHLLDGKVQEAVNKLPRFTKNQSKEKSA